jgi:hypothetical protein
VVKGFHFMFAPPPQILFLGPLMQLSMDCPCDLTDGLKVVLGESSRLRKR